MFIYQHQAIELMRKWKGGKKWEKI
jgi:hypothetical protein